MSVFTITGKTVTPSGKVEVGTPESLLSGIVFTRDGRRALVTRNNDSLIAVLAIEGTTVTNTKADIAANVKPYGIDVTPAGDTAVVASIGVGATGGADTFSVIDLSVIRHERSITSASGRWRRGWRSRPTVATSP